MDLRHVPDILNTELQLSQKQSKTTSSVGLETIELSDLIINMDFPPDVLAMIMPVYIQMSRTLIYTVTLSTKLSPYSGDQLKAYKRSGGLYLILTDSPKHK